GAIYNDALAGAEILCPRGAGEAFVAHLYVVRSARRDALREELKAAGIATDIHYPIPDHLQESVRREGRAMVSLPVTERVANEILTLPCYPELRNDETERIANVLRDVAARVQA